jgi:hypothetical protein
LKVRAAGQFSENQATGKDVKIWATGQLATAVLSYEDQNRSFILDRSELRKFYSPLVGIFPTDNVQYKKQSLQ